MDIRYTVLLGHRSSVDGVSMHKEEKRLLIYGRKFLLILRFWSLMDRLMVRRSLKWFFLTISIGIMDYDLTLKRKEGCEDLLKAVTERIKPLYHVFGHIHEGHGVMEKDGTTFVNAAICDARYCAIQEPIVFELPVKDTECWSCKEGFLTIYFLSLIKNAFFLKISLQEFIVLFWYDL